MPDPSTVATHVRFGPFTLDVRAGELRKGATRLKVPDQSIEILKALVERPGELVTRDELRHRLWPANHFVDFEHGLNAAIRRLRDALGDSAETAKYIETLPRKGYRFISPVDPAGANGSNAAASPALVAPPGKPRLAWRSAVVFVVLVGLAASLIVLNRRRTTTPTANSSAGPTFTQLTFEPGLQMNPALSPDGKYVAYASNQNGNFDIWVKPTDPAARAIQVTTDAAHDWQPDWSPDSTQIVFRSEREGGGLYVVPALGGTAHRVADFGYAPRWSPDGTRVLFSRVLLAGAAREGVFIVDLRGGPPHVLDVAAFPEWDQGTQEIGWHPDGKHVIVFKGTGPAGKAIPSFVTIDVEHGTAHRSAMDPKVLDGFIAHRLGHTLTPENVVWSRDLRTIYFAGYSRGIQNVWAVDVDPHTLAITGGPRRLTTMSETNEGISISRDETRMVFGSANRNARVWLYTLAPGGEQIVRGEPVSDEKVYAMAPDLTRDGRKLLLLTQRRGSGTGLTEFWELLIGGASRLLLSSQSSRGERRQFPRWSSDGTQIVYRYIRPGPGSSDNLHQVRSLVLLNARTLNETQLTTPVPIDPGDEIAYGWTPDDRFIVSSTTRLTAGQAAIVLIPTAEAPDAEKHAIVVTQSAEYSIWNSGMSPNQKWICFQAVREGQSQLAVVASTGGPWRWLTGKDAWIDKPRWSADGRIIYFISRRGGVFNVWGVEFDAQTGRAAQQPFQLTHFDGLSGEIPADVWTVELGISDRHMAVPVIHPAGGIWMLENFRQ